MRSGDLAVHNPTETSEARRKSFRGSFVACERGSLGAELNELLARGETYCRRSFDWIASILVCGTSLAESSAMMNQFCCSQLEAVLFIHLRMKGKPLRAHAVCALLHACAISGISSPSKPNTGTTSSPILPRSWHVASHCFLVFSLVEVRTKAEGFLSVYLFPIRRGVTARGVSALAVAATPRKPKSHVCVASA